MRKPNPYKFLNKKERRDKLVNDRYYELDEVFHLVELDLWCNQYSDRQYPPTARVVRQYPPTARVVLFREYMCQYYRLWLHGTANGVKVVVRFHIRFLANRLEYSIVVAHPVTISNYTYDAKDVRDSQGFVQALADMNYQPALSLLRKQTIDEILLDL